MSLVVEHVLVMLTAAKVITALCMQGYWWEGIQVSFLAGLSVLLERWCQLQGKADSNQREASGIALGALCVPCVLATVLNSLPGGRYNGALQSLLHGCFLCTFAALTVTFFRSSLHSQQQKQRLKAHCASIAQILFCHNARSSRVIFATAFAAAFLACKEALCKTSFPMLSASCFCAFTAHSILSFTSKLLAATTCMCALIGQLPASLTMGEAVLLGQSLLLFLHLACQGLLSTCDPNVLLPSPWGCSRRYHQLSLSSSRDIVSMDTLLAETAVLAVLATAFALSPLTEGQRKESGRPSGTKFRAVSLLAHSVVLCGGVHLAFPAAMWALRYIVASRQRSLLTAYSVLVLAVGLPSISWGASKPQVPVIVARKLYHFLGVALMLPPALLQPDFACLALAIGLLIFILLEALRVAEFPFIGPALERLFRDFLDTRDGGVMITSHFSLLLGMSGPVWFSKGVKPPPVHSLAGIVFLGVADSTASVVGRLWGRHRITELRNKTMEGTGAGAIAALLSWWLLKTLPGAQSSGAGRVLSCSWAQLVAATGAAVWLEASTTQMDNLVVPLYYMIWLA